MMSMLPTQVHMLQEVRRVSVAADSQDGSDNDVVGGRWLAEKRRW